MLIAYLHYLLQLLGDVPRTPLPHPHRALPLYPNGRLLSLRITAFRMMRPIATPSLATLAYFNKKTQLTQRERATAVFVRPLRTNVKYVKTSILVRKDFQGHCFRCQSKPVYDFLLVINCNLGPMSHRFRDMASYWFKIAEKIILPPSHLGPPIGVTPMEFLEKRYIS